MTEGKGFVMNNGDDKGEPSGEAMPKIDFSSFILSLYSSGLVQLGKVEDPSTGKKAVNLDMAQHSIDMIAMLQEKTTGNLTDDEDNLTKALLSELRMAYVEATA
ncbi:MAG: DUF1844 domain-containing protein [Desulfobacterales bacterium]|nr:DUF1844 domain-containing protein [Desulfobacterales bacterium]